MLKDDLKNEGFGEGRPDGRARVRAFCHEALKGKKGSKEN